VADTRDRLHSNLLFSGAFAIMTAVTFAFGIQAGVTLSRIRRIAGSVSEQTPVVAAARGSKNIASDSTEKAD
jgi:hypothetical protein